MNSILRYDNGLRAVVCGIAGVRSVSSGFWLGAGSAFETELNNGISHFTEHVTFKGTDKLSAFDIANKFENFGANVNAFTSKECTCYYVKSVDDYSESCFSLLSEIIFESQYDPTELDKERKVIIEEINMVEDSPEDLCYDEIAAATYGTTGLGRTILGPAKNVLRFSQSDVAEYASEMYTPSNTVIAFAGNITPEGADKLIRKYVLPHYAGNYGEIVKPQNTFAARCYREKIKPFEQSNIALAFPSLPFGDLNLTVQASLNAILGGGMSSRLFQSVREQQGLAYSVYSAPSGYSSSGTLNIYLNISKENTQKALSAVRRELDKIKTDGITEEELARTKVQLKSALVFAGESVQSLMSAAGKLLLLKDELYDVDDKIARIDRVTVRDVNDFAASVLDYEKLNAAYVGKEQSTDILSVF